MGQSQPLTHTDWRPLHAWSLVALIVTTAGVPALRISPLLWLVPLVAYTALVTIIQPLRTTFRPWRFGRVSPLAVIATFTIALSSCLVLVAFQYFAHPGAGAVANLIPVYSLGGPVAAGILFSIFNALFEEVIFRGILFDAAESQWGVKLAVIGTALLFGHGHLHGYPPGLFGAMLAGIFGLGLGWLRVSTDGLGLPIIAHAAADATIFTILARSGIFQSP